MLFEGCNCLLVLVVLRKDGSTPMKYAFRLNAEDSYADMRSKLAELSCVPPDYLLFAELSGPFVKTYPMDSQKIKRRIGTMYPVHAYEIEYPIVVKGSIERAILSS